jgi:hypothetical protein
MPYEPAPVSGLSRAIAVIVLRRVAAGRLSRAALCRRTLMSQSHCCNWLAGKKVLSPKLCDSVLVALRLTLGQALAGDPDDAPRRCEVVEIPGAADPRRGPAMAMRVPAWRRVAGCERLI